LLCIKYRNTHQLINVMVNMDIVEFYPSPVCIHDRLREMFATYGTCASVNVKPASAEPCVKKKMRQSSQTSSFLHENLAVEFQSQNTHGCTNKLFAAHSSYPLLPPNACM